MRPFTTVFGFSGKTCSVTAVHARVRQTCPCLPVRLRPGQLVEGHGWGTEEARRGHGVRASGVGGDGGVWRPLFSDYVV